MENSFSNYIGEQVYYPFFPFIQYYNPKVFNTYNLNNNLEESTFQIPQTPEANPNQEEFKPLQVISARN
jgi:hypothetical protein